MSLRKLDILEVYTIHETVIKLAKTKASIRDFSLLHSAVERPYATFEGKDLYPTIFLKAGALIQSICLNHAFSDGNKRTAWLTTKRFLWINGYHLKSDTKSAVDFMIWIDNVHPELGKITSWLKKHSKVC
jgi:death-on-curing protein